MVGSKKLPGKKESEMEADAMERMDRALREAMKTPPKRHKDEPKHVRVYKKRGKPKDE